MPEPLEGDSVWGEEAVAERYRSHQLPTSFSQETTERYEDYSQLWIDYGGEG